MKSIILTLAVALFIGLISTRFLDGP